MKLQQLPESDEGRVRANKSERLGRHPLSAASLPCRSLCVAAPLRCRGAATIFAATEATAE